MFTSYLKLSSTRRAMTGGQRGTRRTALLPIALLAVGLSTLTAAPAAVAADVGPASHYRATQVTWVESAENEAEFEISASFRRSFYGDLNVGDTFQAGSFDFGDGDSGNSVTFTAVSVDIPNDVVTGAADVTHDYGAPGPFTASLTDCCRLSGPNHINNPDGNIRVESLVDLAATTASPESLISPIVDCPSSGVCQFAVAALDPDGQPLRFRLATAAESGLSFQPGPPQAPNAASVDATTGVYSWDTTGAELNDDPTLPTFYSTQVIVENVVGSAVVATTAVDFFIRLGTGTSNNAPLFTAPTPDDGSVITADVGDVVTFDTAAVDPDVADTVTLGIIGAPADATYVTTAGNPAVGTFSWTPTATGDTILVLTAADQSGLQATQRSLTISVGNGGNTAPVASDDSYMTVEDTSLSVLAPGVLGNDTDADGDALTADLVASTPHGTLALAPDGSFTYTPEPDFIGTDSFTYVANDGTDTSALATVAIEVTPEDTPLTCTIQGSPDDDVLVGDAGDDVICGGDGDDRMYGRGGNDVIIGGDGDDFARGGIGDDVLIGGAGEDELFGRKGNDVLIGGFDDDHLVGGPGEDLIFQGPRRGGMPSQA